GFGMAGPFTSAGASVIELATGKVICRLEAAGGQINGIVFSPDGRRVATVANAIGARRGIMKIWDASTGRELLTQDMDQTAIASLSYDALNFSPDGHRLTLKLGNGFNGFGGWSPGPAELVWDATPRPEPIVRQQ